MAITRKIAVSLATVGGLGSVGVAPGTVASGITIIALYVLSMLGSLPRLYSLFVLSVVALTCVAVHYALPVFDQQDPSDIVLDEVVGTLTTFLWVQPTWRVLVLGFLLYRFFDISKLFGIDQVERLPGMWGVVIDDIVAGLYASVVLYLLPL